MDRLLVVGFHITTTRATTSLRIMVFDDEKEANWGRVSSSLEDTRSLLSEMGAIRLKSVWAMVATRVEEVSWML